MKFQPAKRATVRPIMKHIVLSPLRGSMFNQDLNPGLTPGAITCRPFGLVHLR
jgi:hypothetical protein